MKPDHLWALVWVRYLLPGAALASCFFPAGEMLPPLSDALVPSFSSPLWCSHLSTTVYAFCAGTCFSPVSDIHAVGKEPGYLPLWVCADRHTRQGWRDHVRLATLWFAIVLGMFALPAVSGLTSVTAIETGRH